VPLALEWQMQIEFLPSDVAIGVTPASQKPDDLVRRKPNQSKSKKQEAKPEHHNNPKNMNPD
jgi:hypothetical protein